MPLPQSARLLCDEAHKCLKKIGLTVRLFWLESAAEKAKTSTWSHPRTQELNSRTRNRIVTHPYQPGLSRVAPRFCKARLVCILGREYPETAIDSCVLASPLRLGEKPTRKSCFSQRRRGLAKPQRKTGSDQDFSSPPDTAAAAAGVPPIPIACLTSARMRSLSVGFSLSRVLTFSRPCPSRSPL